MTAIDLVDSICYMSVPRRVLAKLQADARAADQLHLQSRSLLTTAVRAGAAAGLTQRQIAQAVGRSQPEVSRLLRFHSITPRGRALMTHRRQILRVLREHACTKPMVFGSVATGNDTDESDIDLLVTFPSPPSLMAIARLERKLSATLNYDVDITPANNLPTHFAQRIQQEAVPI